MFKSLCSNTFIITAFCSFLIAVLHCAAPAAPGEESQHRHHDNSSSSAPHSHSNVLAFGSCARQYKPQPVWKSVASVKPRGWLWLGDVIYPNCSDPNCISEGYEMFKSVKEYQLFKSQVEFIEGTWDDHDYGINDGGKEFQYKHESKDLFLDFIGVSPNSPRRLNDGVYVSRLFPIYSEPVSGAAPQSGEQENKEEGAKVNLSADQQEQENANKQRKAINPVEIGTVKLILLDTRFNREPGRTPNLNRYPFIPFANILGAVFRMFSPVLSLVLKPHAADMLGETQWYWLRRELEEAKMIANATVIASSIQILSSVPVFESWTHYPHNRRRLFNLINEIKPPGLTFISGDIHIGNLLGNPNCVIEFTSSGLTHSARNHRILGKLLSAAVLPYFQLNFPFPHQPNTEVDPANLQFYDGQNFGTLEFQFLPNGSRNSGGSRISDSSSTQTLRVTGTIYSEDGIPKLRAVRDFTAEGSSVDYSCLYETPVFDGVSLSAVAVDGFVSYPFASWSLVLLASAAFLLLISLVFCLAFKQLCRFSSVPLVGVSWWRRLMMKISGSLASHTTASSSSSSDSCSPQSTEVSSKESFESQNRSSNRKNSYSSVLATKTGKKPKRMKE